MFGFINLNKPQGFTSHDCVAKTRRLLQTKKVGHGGTLDPEATGVLPIAIGKATKLLQFLPEAKAYRARIRLGIQTTTDDLEGEVIADNPVTDFNQDEILEHLQQFKGEIEQTPPIYSAIKKQGKKLYEFARQGIEVEVPKRQVTIYGCELKQIIPGEYPELILDIDCGAGTYIRAIARDLGQMLGVGGTLANLVRTKSCSMKLQDSLDFETIEQQLETDSFELITPDSVLAHLPRVSLDSLESKRWCQGQIISLRDNKTLELGNNNLENIEYIRIYDLVGIFLGIAILRNHEAGLSAKPKIVCASLD